MRISLGIKAVPLLSILAALAGCSGKGATAPKKVATPSPTQFAVFASDRNRTAGYTRNFITGLDVLGTYGFTFGTGTAIIDRHPSITSNGNLLVYESSPGRGGSHDVFGFNRGSGTFTDDTNINTNANETDPYVSLDGLRLAFVRETLGKTRILLYSTQTQTFIALPGLDGPASSNDWAPALDGGGQHIVFVSDRNGNPDVFVYTVATQSLASPASLVSTGDDIEPTISGDGRYVCFASNRTGGLGSYDLYLYDRIGSALVPIPAPGNSSVSDRDPAINYDGSHVQFASDRTGGLGGLDIWMLDLVNGTVGVREVSGQNSTADDSDPVLVWR